MIGADLSFSASPVEPFRWRGLDLFVKRDDLIDPRFSGNKFRKLYTLFKLPNERYRSVVSYGGAQSNAMLSIAYLAAMKGWHFRYYVKEVPKWLKERPVGNLARALELGMQLHEIPHGAFYDTVERVRASLESAELFIPQGGADPVAAEGVAKLAEEIVAWARRTGVERFSVALPSGTGTTALFLAKSLPETVTVATTPVVGDEETLLRQWAKLAPEGGPLPKILHSFGKHPFAKPHPAFLKVYRELKEGGIEFDLIYAPKMWIELGRAAASLPGPILYIHSGGVSGNLSQLQNYRFRGIDVP
ncbi:pyridoxal-phosphate dependent enzyme [Hydrogenimonas sp.]